LLSNEVEQTVSAEKNRYFFILTDNLFMELRQSPLSASFDLKFTVSSLLGRKCFVVGNISLLIVMCRLLVS